MALIEGVGDEVTLLFSLVFMMLVLALAWLSTRTVDRGEQTLPPTQSTPTDSTEQLDSGCPSCREGSLQSEAGIPEHSTEQQRNGAEGEMDGAERDGALMDRVERAGAERAGAERAGAERAGAERDGAVRERDGEVKKRDVRVRDGAERERDEDRVERESVRRGAERSKAEGERDEEEGEGVRVAAERETGRDGVVGEGVRDGVEGAQGREGDRRSDGEEGGKQRDRVERKKEGERQSDGVEGERQTDGVEGGGQRAEAERDKQRNGEDGEQRRDKEEGERQRDGDERETDRAEGERQEKEKRSDTERQVVDEREKSPVAGAAADSFPDDVPVEVRQRGSAARVGDDTGVQPPHTDSAQDSSMLMRLKFLNETERIIQVRPEQTIGYIKRTQFPQQEHQVRLIYQGQLLGDDAQTLSSLHITSNCVIHCHISQNATPQSPAGSQAAENTDSTLNIGGLMLPLFFLMLSILWYYQINYRHFFTVPATISLVGITILFSFVAFGAYRR